MDDYAVALGLDVEDKQEDENGRQIYILDSSDEFAKVYTRLDDSEDAFLESDRVVVNSDGTEHIYIYDDNVQVKLISDFTTDTYKVEISRG